MSKSQLKTKVTLSSSRDIPFNKLVLSQANVRQIKTGVSIEDLAADIARRGLLQNLVARPVVDDKGSQTGMFEVPAGGRRYRALQLLVEQKRLNKTAPVPCIVRDVDSDILPEDDSLAENTQRAPLHPLDQFRAFQALREKSQSEADIAAAFFVDPKVVKQRLRLAEVSPALLERYADDEMDLETLMAFTVNPDHVRQQQVWEQVKDSWSNSPHQIRRMLTETAIRASDKRALFVGVEAYVNAGGAILRDLFEDDRGGWLQDAPLLETLATDKLKACAEKIAEEGWKWIAVAYDFPYGHANELRELTGSQAELTEDEAAAYEALKEEFEVLEVEYAQADELPEEVDKRLGELEGAMEAVEARPIIYDPTDIEVSGVFVSIGGDGTLIVDGAYVRSEDEATVDQDGEERTGSTEPGTTISINGQDDETEEADETIKPLPDRLVAELTAHRTLALRDAVANHPHVAMTTLLHKLVGDTFHHQSTTGCLEASVRSIYFAEQASDLKESQPATSIQTRHDAWQKDVPQDDQERWGWLEALDDDNRSALLAHCVSFGINALHEKVDRYGGGLSRSGLERRMGQADRLAKAVNLDMVDVGWKPTADNYFGRVTKARIVEAVREGAGEQPAQLIDHLKKGDMAKEAERLLAESSWLPEPLRLLDEVQASDGADEAGSAEDGEPLPAFLEDDEVEEDAEHLVAAE